MISKSSAPGKVILFGEHFVVHGTRALLCAINRRVFVTAEPTDRDEIEIESEIANMRMGRGADIPEVDARLRPIYFLAETMLQKQSKVAGVRVVIESEIPPGVGLGSSSACCVAGAGAISGLFAARPRQEILELAVSAERTVFESTSGADCTASVFGGIIEYGTGGFARIESRPGFRLVIANSKTEHATREVVEGVRKFKEADEKRFAEMCSKESDLIRDALEMIDKGRTAELGKTASQNQELLEAIGVSNDTLREMIRLGNGSSYGSKITGAGGGGCIYSVTDDSNAKETLDGFKRGGFECFLAEIDHTGLDTF